MRYLILLVMLGEILSLQAQIAPNRAQYRLRISETQAPMQVDGQLDEPAWQMAEVADSFFRVLPIDTGYASGRSEARMSYDQKMLYVGIIFWDAMPGKRPVESLRRDFSFSKNDNFLLFLDTYNNQTSGFSFGASAAGAQWDGLMSNGAAVNLDWDCKWKSAVRNYDDRWVIEMGIPFKSIRYQEGVGEWGINFSRLDLKRNEKSSWAPVPRQFPTASLAFTGTLVWDKPPPSARSFVSLIPYVSTRVVKDHVANTPTEPGWDAGGDAKIGLTPTLNLDLTINPDFSQVEVDRQVTNLDRFELFFPERRRFFLENSDVFSQYGMMGIRPFFSRRIGLESPVRAGMRLSGNLGEDWRVGLLNMQTGSRESVPPTNFTVATVQRKVFARSNLGMFFVNKQLTVNQADSTYSDPRYNRVAGLDYNLASANNRWQGKLFFHQSFQPNQNQDTRAMGGYLEYNTEQFSLGWNQAYVGKNYKAEAGFVRRTGFHQLNPFAFYRFNPAAKGIANHGPFLQIDALYDTEFKITDRNIELGYKMEFLNRSSVSAEWTQEFVRLLDPFDPTNTGRDTLATGSRHQWQTLTLSYESDGRKLFNYEIDLFAGGFFSGTLVGIEGDLNFRVQPYGSLAMSVAYNRLTFPTTPEAVNLVLIGPRLDITFTDKLFLTTFVQYNNQIDNLNINARFQWRYAPVSDLFIVYTDNYFPAPFQVKNRALVAKVSYWLN